MSTVLPSIQTEKNTFDYFSQHVKESLKNQHISISKTSEQYLVHLLADFTFTRNTFNLTKSDNRPLAIIYHQAQHETAENKIKIFKDLGDFSLFITGFFPDSLNRKVTDVDYYIFLGKSAYENLSVIFKKNHKEFFYTPVRRTRRKIRFHCRYPCRNQQQKLNSMERWHTETL